jgi:four helix bundle protein
MKPNVLKDKSFGFAVRIVNLYRFLSDNKKEFILSKQILRSGTAIGALYREAEHAESKQDFIHKLSIAQKECNETMYWLDVLKATDYIDSIEHKSISKDCDELMALLVSIIKSAKENNIK